MIEIDGSIGEGGGQVLRSSLSASLITGTGFKIKNIRSRRSQPGLRAQHLTAVDSAAAIGQAQVEGAHRSSTELTFIPKTIRTGKYKFDIGTAGSTLLVLQTILPPLSLANSATSVSIHGGTHVPMAPCFHYVEKHWLTYLAAIGFDVKLELVQAGYYPEGGGRISATIRPVEQTRSINLQNRGRLRTIQGISGVTNLPNSIAERQKHQALWRLKPICDSIQIKSLSFRGPGKGTFLLLRAIYDSFENNYEPAGCFFGLGAIGKPAERVADEAVEQLLAYHNDEAAVDAYLADQLLLPLSLTQDISYLNTERVTDHLSTNARIIQRFLPVQIDIYGDTGAPGTVIIRPDPGIDMQYPLTHL